MRVTYLTLAILAVVLALGPAPSVLAGDGEWMIAFSDGSWFVPCGAAGGQVQHFVHAAIPAGFTWTTTLIIIDATGEEQRFIMTEVMTEFVYFDGYDLLGVPVPPNGTVIWIDQLVSPVGVEVSNTSILANCATGEIRINDANIYAGFKEPDPATRQYGLVTAQTAVYSQPDLTAPVANVTLYPGEKWFVTDTIDGAWYKVYLSGAKYVYVPTSAMRLISADEWYAPQTVTK
ncbi:MAG: hypothetical protein GXY36_05020 [Chloroflexi bacterium]|nr:hypothetical protein [Chloroflexota bacterium]